MTTTSIPRLVLVSPILCLELTGTIARASDMNISDTVIWVDTRCYSLGEKSKPLV